MTSVDAIWRQVLRPATICLLAALPLLAGWGARPALAQSIMRSPNLNISSRMPSSDHGPTLHINPNFAGRGITGLGNDIRIHPSCTAAERDSGVCSDQATGSQGRQSKGGRGNALDASLASRAIPNEIVAEIDAALTDAQADALARRHGLRRIESRKFELIGATLGLFRIVEAKASRRRAAISHGMAAFARFSRTCDMCFRIRRQLLAKATRRSTRRRNCACRRRTRLPMAPMSRL